MVNNEIDKATPARLKVQVDHTKFLLRELSLAQSTNLVGKSINYLWMPPVQPKYVKPEFQPKYWQQHCESDKAVNSIIEIRSLWQYVIHDALYNYSNIYSQLSIPLTTRIKLICQKHREAFAVYDTKTQEWLIKPGEQDYKYCYNGEFFEEFKQGKKQMPTDNRLLLVGKYTIMKQEDNLLTKTKSAPTFLDTFVMPKTGLTVGVPGCGKTTYILNKHNYGNLVLTSCAEGAQDIRSRMAKIKGGLPSHYRHSYRTIDSYLLNSRGEYAHVWIDEALMEHPGKLFLVCLFSRCRALSLLGDPNQLGYINRVKAIRLRYDKSSMFFKPTETLNISYRCPVDVMAVLSSKYDEGAYSASDVLRSMKCKSFTRLTDVPKVEHTKYLVFKQAEKIQMQKAGYDVSTVHEFQGKEATHVILVRMSRNLSEELYKSAPHILVGITRHKESLIYFTPVRDDIEQTIELSQAMKQLEKYKKNTSTVFERTVCTESSDSLTFYNSDHLRTDKSVRRSIDPSIYTGTGAFPSSITPQISTAVAPSYSKYHEKSSCADNNPERTIPAERIISKVSKRLNSPSTTSNSDSLINKQATYASDSYLEPRSTNKSHYRQSTPSASGTITHRHTSRFEDITNRTTDYSRGYYEPFLANERSNYRQPTTSGSNRRYIPCCCIL